MSLPESVAETIRGKLTALKERERQLDGTVESTEHQLARYRVEREDVQRELRELSDYLTANGEPLERAGD